MDVRRTFRRVMSIDTHAEQRTQDPPKWGLRAIRWKMVFWYQDWAIIFVALMAVAAFVREFFYGFPVERTVLLYDATISLPHVKNHTVESWQAAVIPLSLMLVTLAWMEFSVFSFSNSITNVITVYLHFSISAMSAWTTAVWITSFFKNWAGRLRPDYLARCHPDLPNGRHWIDPKFEWGHMMTVNCTQTNLEKLRHGHFSFPSQHSCWAMTAAWYTVLYISWVSHSRSGGMIQINRFRVVGWLRLAREAVAVVAFLFLGGQVMTVWLIGVSRFKENRHNISDIVAGWFMGFLISSLYAKRAIYVYAAIRKEIIHVEKGLEQETRHAAREPLLPQTVDVEDESGVDISGISMLG